MQWLLRVVRRRGCPPAPAPVVVSVDDWAWKRNPRYGTITSAWSNGQTEGQITKLKLVKRRQMYGRAKLDLLEARLIGAS